MLTLTRTGLSHSQRQTDGADPRAHSLPIIDTSKMAYLVKQSGDSWTDGSRMMVYSNDRVRAGVYIVHAAKYFCFISVTTLFLLNSQGIT